MIAREETKLRLQGSEVYLFGCNHFKDIDVPHQTDLYNKVGEFDPDVIFVEIQHLSDLSTAANKCSDLRVLEDLAQREGIELIAYDKNLSTYKDHMRALKRDEHVCKKLKELSDGGKFVTQRRKIRDCSTDIFESVFERREENGFLSIIKNAGEYNKIGFHCGESHYTAYKSIIEFVSDHDFIMS